MPDINREASEFWNSLKPMIDEEIKTQTRGMVQRRKMKVTTAPSLNTNKIGVTEPFGTEMLIPFTTNLISATVGDVVWVEFMYGMTNAFASMFASADEKDWDVAGNLSVIGNAGIGGDLGVSGSTSLQNTTVNGVLDITPRRCYATQLDAGWHRVMAFSATSSAYSRGATGTEVVFHITRRRTTAGEETHEIKMLCGYDGIKFVDETSSSTSGYQRIYKIRYTYSGNNGYVDINCTGACAHTTVAFEVYCEPAYQALYTAASLESVADSPSGETVMTEYAFVANNTGEKIEFTPTSGTAYANYGNCWYAKSGNVVQVHVGISGLTANTNTTIFTIPEGFRPKATAIATGKAGSNLTYAQLQVGYSTGSVQVISSGTYAMCDITYIV